MRRVEEGSRRKGLIVEIENEEGLES